MRKVYTKDKMLFGESFRSYIGPIINIYRVILYIDIQFFYGKHI